MNNPVTKGLSLYEYTATGVKLTKSQYHDPNNVLQPLSAGVFTEADFKDKGYPLKETRYENNLEFENWTLKRILTENGYIENNKYYFYIKDYLGNNRVVADQSGVVVQRMSYYPFGMSVSTPGQPYRFGGKELDAMYGLNLYDFHARQQMPDLGIFTSMDPLAEKYYSWSPYSYCFNNPTRFIDPTGMGPGDSDASGVPSKIIYDPNTGQRGGYTAAQSSTYIPVKEPVQPIKLTNEQKMEQFIKSSEANKGTLKQDQSSFEKQMNILASPEDKMVSGNPIVQGALVVAVAPEVAAIGNAVMTTIETTAVSSVLGGAVEGVVKTSIEAPPDTPYLIDAPIYRIFSDLTNNIVSIYNEFQKKKENK